MALKLRQNVEFGKTSLVVYDTTCTFNSGYNESGYGGPNPEPDGFQITMANVSITPRGASEPVVIDVFPILPNTEGAGIEINMEDLGLSEMPVGVWTVKYTITLADSSTVETECKFLNDCSVQCCIDQKTKSIDPLCDIEKFNYVSHLASMLKSANSAHCAGEYDKANDIIDYVNETCNCCC